MDRATFLIRYPEFANVDSAMIDAALVEQDLNVADSWAAAERDDIVALKTAHVLTLGPQGRNARLASSKERNTEIKTTYQIELERRIKSHACANLRIL